MIWAWGDNSYSQVGARTREAYYTTPIRVERSGLVNNNDLNTQYLTGVVAVAAGRNFSVALLADGTVMTWGAAYMNNAWNYDLGDVNRTRTNQERNSSGYAYLTSGVAGGRTTQTTGTQRMPMRVLKNAGEDAGYIGRYLDQVTEIASGSLADQVVTLSAHSKPVAEGETAEIGRASCRERV